ncbi:MAG: hypothetical protein H6512_08900 [Acidimicrobiia bacterium]|nr:hypothetical protein [Acidimicrobiia bacterium]
MQPTWRAFTGEVGVDLPVFSIEHDVSEDDRTVAAVARGESDGDLALKVNVRRLSVVVGYPPPPGELFV